MEAFRAEYPYLCAALKWLLSLMGMALAATFAGVCVQLITGSDWWGAYTCGAICGAWSWGGK